MKKLITVDNCRFCDFFGNSMDGMECRHPYFEKKAPYKNMIITQDNIQNNNTPEKCPLRGDPLTIVYQLSEKEYY